MEKESLNKKWLEGRLTEEEQIAFDVIEDNELLKQIIDKAPAFSASNFSEVQDVEILKSKIKSKNNLLNKRNWLVPMLRIASVFVIAFGIYFLFFFNNAINIETAIGEKRMVQLPDASEVMLNAVSEITFNKNTWADKRELILEGEAFFKVAKGSTFDVVTSIGKVSVLGTEFNVKQRKNLFEVNCFEGLVAVSYKKETLKLLPGHIYRILNGKISSDTISNKEKPFWINHTSYFKKVPFHEVIKELERQYKVVITVNQKDESLLFTGGFTHKNLEEALESITTPLKLVYDMESPTKISLHHSE
ncbi:FecR domain-containing protein [Algibacter agarivorans]|uniref:FecR domain-containing protein n=1 Tax=Algibacter agarivorans TaxID=1109741 RepID=A0ABP9GK06_9FLAO